MNISSILVHQPCHRHSQFVTEQWFIYRWYDIVAIGVTFGWVAAGYFGVHHEVKKYALSPMTRYHNVV